MSSLVYELAVVEDRGTHWVVTNVTKNSLDTLANREEKHLKLSYVSYKLISDALNAGKQATITKSMMTDEVLPFEVTIKDPSESTDPLRDARDASLVKMRMLVTPEFSKIAGLTLYSFIILNNDLSSRGFCITDKNREEMYITILETGDEELIQRLEDYLNFRDEIERVANLERVFSAFRKNVSAAATIEDIVAIETKFLEHYYSLY